MEHYDPLLAPDPAEWLASEEEQRIALVVNYHEGALVKLPNQRVHAAIHVIVENQIATGDALPVRRVLDRLLSEGLDRHEAIHTIGSALAGHLSDLLHTGSRKGDAPEAYWAELGRITAEEWRRAR
jgi:hypothetical protein